VHVKDPMLRRGGWGLRGPLMYPLSGLTRVVLSCSSEQCFQLFALWFCSVAVDICVRVTALMALHTHVFRCPVCCKC
jgi:hypothetical protein